MTVSAQLRAGIYARQSHGKQTSVDDQVNSGEARCAALGASVARTYRDRVSASRFGTTAREDWPILVDDVAGGRLDLVWLWDSSRGDRTPETWFAFLGACRARGVLIHAERDQRTYDVRIPRDWKTLAESGVDAAYESEIRSVDVRRGIAGAAEKGKAHGRVGYGYDRVYDQADRRKFTQVPNEFAPIVHEIIERVAKRDPIITITRSLNERGISSPWGAQWTRQSVRAITTNARYAGLRDHKGTLYPGDWPAIVDRTTWESARAVLGEPGRKSTAPGALKWLLSYLIVTPCGSVVNVQPLRDGRPARYKCLADGCVSVALAEADEYVGRLILGRMTRPDARKAFASNDSAIDGAQDDLATIQTEARELEAEVRAGRMRPTLAAAFDASIQERLAEARARIGTAGTNAAALALLGDGEFVESTARPRWDALSVAAKRSVITALIERIELRAVEVRLTRWSTDLERLAVASDRIVPKWRELIS